MDWVLVQGYGSIFMVTVLGSIFIAYIVHLYRYKQTTGDDIEDLAKLALNDKEDDPIIKPKE